MNDMEAFAASPAVGAATLYLDTFSNLHESDPAYLAKTGRKPGPLPNEVLYARRGFEVYNRAAKFPWAHPETGEKMVLQAVFMKKRL